MPYCSASDALQVVENMPITEIHFLFTMLKMPFVLVMRKGRLQGMISKDTLIQEYINQTKDT